MFKQIQKDSSFIFQFKQLQLPEIHRFFFFYYLRLKNWEKTAISNIFKYKSAVSFKNYPIFVHKRAFNLYIEENVTWIRPSFTFLEVTKYCNIYVFRHENASLPPPPKKKSFMQWWNYNDIQATHVYAQYYTFLINYTKGKTMKEATLKFDKICISKANCQNTWSFHRWLTYSC